MPEKIENKNRFEGNRWAFESRAELAQAATDEIVERLTTLGWSDEELGIFPVAVKEALANAVIHGNPGLKRKEGGRT